MGKRRALLVGINYPGTAHTLNGCVNDVTLMADVLTNYFGFTDPTEVRMLTDNSATTDAIKERLEWLVNGAEPGDVLYFHYSGHGSQMVNQTYDADYEPDNLDEVICPVDLDWRTKIIRDDDLKRVFDKVPAGVNLTVMLDCCNSGSGLDQVNQFQPFGIAKTAVQADSPNKSRLLPMPVDIANRARNLDLKVRDRSVQSRDVNNTGLLVSGCQSHQTSADAWIHDRYMGAATYYLYDTLKKHNWDVDYETLVIEMNNSLASYGYTQRPELNGSGNLFGTKFLQPLVVGTGLDAPATVTGTEEVVEEVVPVIEEPIVDVVEDPEIGVVADEEISEDDKKPWKKWLIYIGVAVAVAIAYSVATMN